MSRITGEGKKFLFLQGPHGPFFYELSRSLIQSGAEVTKIGFNAGDRYYWPETETFIPFTGDQTAWKSFFSAHIKNGITDLVLYGDVRDRHRHAVSAAKKAGIRVHCFEEGYLRPYWATYERDGVNGNSRLMEMSIDQMREGLSKLDEEQPAAPANWGELRQHMYFGAIYHWHVMFRNKAFRGYETHRKTPISSESWYQFRRLLLQPFHSARRTRRTWQLKRSGNVYHLVLLQLGHDSSISEHSSFECVGEFMELCAQAFAEGAPKHHHIVFKAHPLEDFRVDLEDVSTKLEEKLGLKGRVHFLTGGKLAQLLNYARTVVTVNSTAAQQALWRGLPVKSLGKSVYSKPEFTSDQQLAEFFATPFKPDLNAYRDYRRYLLATSQIMGGFYSKKSRTRLTRQVVDMVLSEDDPYTLLSESPAAPVQQLRLVH